jgi:hypothetical protein
MTRQQVLAVGLGVTMGALVTVWLALPILSEHPAFAEWFRPIWLWLRGIR